MTFFAVDGQAVPASAGIFGNGFFIVQRRPVLVKLGCLDSGSPDDRTDVRLEFIGQEFEKSCLA